MVWNVNCFKGCVAIFSNGWSWIFKETKLCAKVTALREGGYLQNKSFFFTVSCNIKVRLFQQDMKKLKWNKFTNNRNTMFPEAVYTEQCCHLLALKRHLPMCLQCPLYKGFLFPDFLCSESIPVSLIQFKTKTVSCTCLVGVWVANK